MTDRYGAIRDDYLRKAWNRPSGELERGLLATPVEGGLQFRAFGEDCLLHPDGIKLGAEDAGGPVGVLVAMYAWNAIDEPLELYPLKAFKELPGSMPYHGAFAANAERVLIPHVPDIQRMQERIIGRFSGKVNDDRPSGDFSFTLYPLPRIALYYVLHLPDEEFPASATALFGASSVRCMPLDGLADIAEYTAKRMVEMVRSS
ncbi:MAG: DUF3786 domain-containing protein [Syntrophobacteraceae bacterium]